MKRILRITIIVAGTVVIILGGLLAFIMITEYRPDPIEQAIVTGSGTSLPDSVHSLTLVTWNIGYAGLGSGMDFFFDGGTRVIPDPDAYRQSAEGIRRFLESQDTVDVFLLQEIDRDAKRSFGQDQFAWLTEDHPDYAAAFAWNYRCRLVPLPPEEPMGRVNSGQATLSRFQPLEAWRIGFDRHPDWPGRLFYLKRCFLTTHFPVDSTRQLIVVNIHNSAFDSTGLLREREMEMLQAYLTEQYLRGNFVVAGGDWNTNPPGYLPGKITTGDSANTALASDLQSWFPGWTFVYDPAVPSNRNVDMPYTRGKTVTTVVDFFLLSPNLSVDTIYTLEQNFAWSDHHPVFLKISWP